MGLFDFLDPMSGAALSAPPNIQEPSILKLLAQNGGGIPPWLLNLPQLGNAGGPSMSGAPTAGNDPFAASVLPNTAAPGPSYSRASQDYPGFGPDLARAPSPFDTAAQGPSYGGASALIPTPANAMPTSDIPAQAAVPPPAPAPGPSGLQALFGNVMQGLGNNSNTLLALAGGFGGARTWGEGIGRASQLAIPASQLDQKQQALNQVTMALVREGKMSPDKAALVANNPKALEQILPRLLGVKQLKFTQIGEDALGNKTFGFVDEASGKTFDRNGQEISASLGGGATVPPSPTTGLPMQGQELLDHLKKNDPVTAAGVEGIIQGNLNAGGRNLQKLKPIAQLVEPGFTEQTYNTRLATAKSYTSGKQFQEMQAIGTVAGHLDDLAKTADKLDNTSFPILNQVKNWWNQNTGDPRVDQFNTVKQAVSNELSKAYRGGHVTEGDVREWQTNINSAKSPEQLKAVIGQFNDLLASKRQVLEEGYKTGMAGGPLPAEFRSESERARQKFDAVAAWAHGIPPAAAPGPQGAASAGTQYAVNPQTGQRLMLRGNQWVPAQ